MLNFPLLHFCDSVFCGSFVYCLLCGDNWLCRLLKNDSLISLGRYVGYVYLLHYPVFHLLNCLGRWFLNEAGLLETLILNSFFTMVLAVFSVKLNKRLLRSLG